MLARNVVYLDNGTDVQAPGDVITQVIGTHKRPWATPEGSSYVPVFSPSGRLMTQRGYDPELKVYLDPDFDPLRLPDHIEDEHVEQALDLLMRPAAINLALAYLTLASTAAHHILPASINPPCRQASE